MKNEEEKRVGLIDKLSINEINYKGEKKLEMIDMMADRKFTEKIIKSKDVLFMKKENYLKKLGNYIQLYKKENRNPILNNDPNSSRNKNITDITNTRRKSRGSVIDFNKLNLHSSQIKTFSKSSNIINNKKSISEVESIRNSISTIKNKSIENFFDGIISPKIDFNKKQEINLLNEEEIKKRQIFLRAKKNKNAPSFKKPPMKTLAQYGTDYIFLKKDTNLNNDLFLTLKNSSYIKKMRDFSIVREDDRMFKEFTKYVRDIYNIKPPCITIFQSINEIRENELKKSNSISNLNQVTKVQPVNHESTISVKKTLSKNSFSSLIKNKSRNRSINGKPQDYHKNPFLNCKNEIITKQAPYRKDLQSIMDNIESNFQTSKTLLKENFKIKESNNDLLKNTFSKTFSTINNDFGKNGLMKQTSSDFIKHFSKKGEFIYGNGSGYYSSSRSIIQPVFNPIKQFHK